MTKEQEIKSLEEEADKLREYVNAKNGLIRLYEGIIKKLENDVTGSEERLYEINDRLDMLENWLGGKE
jgi:predicted  nucleic acid-binding Zn-ribbon protein